MAVNVAIGIQRFDELIDKKCFYIDKTDFIREWWESNDSVTLINRPRRFGKTLNMSMVEHCSQDTGEISGDQFVFCECEGEELSVCKKKNLSASYKIVCRAFLFTRQ